MGFSNAVGAVVVISGLLLATTVLMTSTRSGYDEISGGYDHMSDSDLDRLHTWLREEHVYYNRSSDKLMLLTFNHGEVVINLDKLTLFIEGQIVTQNVTYQVNWVNRSKIFPSEEGILTIDQQINISFSDIGYYNRFVSPLFSAGANATGFSAYDAFYILGNATTQYVIGRYHFNGELDWEVDIAAHFNPQNVTSMEVDRDIYICSSQNYVNAFDMNGNFLRTYQRDGLNPVDSCRANGNLYVVEGGGGAFIFDLLTTNYLGVINQNVSDAIAVDADTSGNIYILDAGQGGGTGDIDVFDSNHNYVGSIAANLTNPLWLTISHYLTEDLIFVLEEGDHQQGVVKVYNLTGVLYDTIDIDDIYPENDGNYDVIEDCGALFLFSDEEQLVIEFRIGYRLWLATEKGVKYLMFG